MNWTANAEEIANDYPRGAYELAQSMRSALTSSGIADTVKFPASPRNRKVIEEPKRVSRPPEGQVCPRWIAQLERDLGIPPLPWE